MSEGVDLQAVEAEIARQVADQLVRTTLFDVPGVEARINLGRTTVFAAIASGELASVRVGARRLVTLAALDDFIARRAGGADATAFTPRDCRVTFTVCWSLPKG